MRPRCSDLRSHRGNYRAVEHSVLLFQRSRREQAIGFDKNSRGNHRLFPSLYREEVIRKRKASQEIDAQLAALEAQLRREQFDGGASPISVAEWEPSSQSAAAD